MIYLALSLALGFLAVLLGTPYARRYLLLSGMFAVDQQKLDGPKLADSGGLTVLFGFLISVTSYVAFSAFTSLELDIATTMAALNSVFIIALIGLLDDIHINLAAVIEEELDIESGELELEIHHHIETVKTPHVKMWEKTVGRFGDREESGSVLREGISQVTKMLFVLPAALPLIAVGAGSWVMHFPVVGAVNWGVLYPLVLLPVGLLFVGNVVNMLAGTNGLAASMSLIASTSLGIYAYLNGSIEAALIGFSLAASLLAFLRYNFYPASILPGDSLTYLAGAAIFSTMVIGNMEKFGVFIFAPWFAEFFLKLRSGFTAHSWGEPREDGTLEPQHEKNYSLTHPLMRRGFSERQVTLALAGMETLICMTALILFTQGIL